MLGLFQFERKDIEDERSYLVIMKNLTMSSKDSIVRTYDIKGRLRNRSTLKEKRIKIDDE